MAYKRYSYYDTDECKRARHEYYRKRYDDWTPLPAATLRVCKKCGRELTIGNFSRAVMSVGGYNTRCKDCLRDKTVGYCRNYKVRSWAKFTSLIATWAGRI